MALHSNSNTRPNNDQTTYISHICSIFTQLFPCRWENIRKYIFYKFQYSKYIMSIFGISMKNASEWPNIGMFGPVVLEIACGILHKQDIFSLKYVFCMMSNKTLTAIATRHLRDNQVKKQPTSVVYYSRRACSSRVWSFFTECPQEMECESKWEMCLFEEL